MSDNNLPIYITQFINNHIDSLTQLELLFLFYKFPDKEWTPVTISQELRSNSSNAAKILKSFAQQGFISLVREPDVYQATATETQTLKAITELHQLYLERPSTVIALIEEKASNKLKKDG